MDKKGALDSTILPLIIISVIGFLILAFAFYQIFSNNSLEQRELCRLSVLSRATAPTAVQQNVPLNCFTEKICITNKDSIFSSSDCKQFAGEKNVRTVKIKIDGNPKEQADAKLIIEKEYANAMFDCWAMTGQGKLDIFKGESGKVEGILSSLVGLDSVIKKIEPKCIVCSRVAISDSVYKADKSNVLSTLDFNGYLSREKVPGSSLTYLQTFTDEIVNGFAGTDKIDLRNNLADASVNTSQIAIVFMQIKTKEDPALVAERAAKLTAVAIGGGGIISGLGVVAVSFPVASILAAIGATGGAYLFAEKAVSDNQAVSFASCNSYSSEDGKEASLGCSLIKPVKWDINSVNNLCYGGIEGNL